MTRSRRKNCFINFIVLLSFVAITNGCGEKPPELAGSYLMAKKPVPSSFDSGIVPFKLIDDLICIEAGPPHSGEYFLVDTGMPFCALDSGAFSELNSSPNDANIHYSLPRVSVGPFEIDNYGLCLYLDLSAISKMINAHIIGIIGLSAFEGGVLQIDYGKNTLRVFPVGSTDASHWGERRSLERAPFFGWQSIFWLDGNPTGVVIDTGSQGFLYATPQLQGSILRGKLSDPDEFMVCTAYGLVRAKRFKAAHLDIDGRDYADIAVWSPNYPVSFFGNPFLKSFVVTLDFQHGFLYLRRVGSAPTTSQGISH